MAEVETVTAMSERKEIEFEPNLTIQSEAMDSNQLLGACNTNLTNFSIHFSAMVISNFLGRTNIAVPLSKFVKNEMVWLANSIKWTPQLKL